MLLFPTYINVFMVYSFCNLHDIRYILRLTLVGEPRDLQVERKQKK